MIPTGAQMGRTSATNTASTANTTSMTKHNRSSDKYNNDTQTTNGNKERKHARQSTTSRTSIAVIIIKTPLSVLSCSGFGLWGGVAF